MLPEYQDASLGGIPEELLVNIVTNLKHDEYTSINLCLTDRRCMRVAEPLLYDHIRTDDRDLPKIRIADRRPSLGKNVRACTYASDGPHRDAFIRILENAHRIRSLECLASLEKSQKRSNGGPGKKTNYLNETITLLKKAVDEPLGQHNRFMRLTHLEIIVNSNLPIEPLSSVFRLPALTSLRLTGFRQTTPFNWTVPASTSLIKDLCLINIWIDRTTLTHMIASIKTLEHFLYSYRIPKKSYRRLKNELLMCKHLGQALRQHRNSLETLCISDYSNYQFWTANEDLGTLGSFADFPKLKELSVPIETSLTIGRARKTPHRTFLSS